MQIKWVLKTMNLTTVTIVCATHVFPSLCCSSPLLLFIWWTAHKHTRLHTLILHSKVKTCSKGHKLRNMNSAGIPIISIVTIKGKIHKATTDLLQQSYKPPISLFVFQQHHCVFGLPAFPQQLWNSLKPPQTHNWLSFCHYGLHEGPDCWRGALATVPWRGRENRMTKGPHMSSWRGDPPPHHWFSSLCQKVGEHMISWPVNFHPNMFCQRVPLLNPGGCCLHLCS